MADKDYSDERTDQQIQNNFIYHAPKGDQHDRYENLRDQLRRTANLINTLVPPSREKSVALTKLEEVGFWANAGIARNE